MTTINEKILYAGDIHGRVIDLNLLIMKAEVSNAISAIIQVGDLGWGSSSLKKFLEDRAKGEWTVPIYTCLGNHDDWNDVLNRSNQDDSSLLELVKGSGVFYVKRGHSVTICGEKHLFLGGALSVDRHLRTEGVNYWKNEEPSYEEFSMFFDNLEKERPRTIVTHEAPQRVPLYEERYHSTTASMLDNVLKHSTYKPTNWFFGHHHKFKKLELDNINFFCCGQKGQAWSSYL